ncbi:uncharacterized protein GIQ15_02737 [Arthroderma uncinatum]|uniref:uncharacterized protein n=1 Tax=Arthroderma uncinatum TaxID=74035 RepID=UPI00144A758E|nr:uncharacterized protein GIQ15_02737 [Arthroderma uncinatum]KAF3483413.1 hypothetical protein GIQ15_02737 [Arthroderma uncinatum]
MGLSEAYNYLTSFYSRSKRNVRHQQRRKANTSGDSLNSSSSQDVFHSAVLAPKKVRRSAITTDEKSESTQSSETSSTKPPAAGLTDTGTANLVEQIQAHLSGGDESVGESAISPPKIPPRNPNRQTQQGGETLQPAAGPMMHRNTTSLNLAVTTGEGVYNGMGTTSKTSSHTALSERSCITVNHDPTKRATSPIETIDRITPSEAESNPFSDGKAMKVSWEGTRSALVPRGSSQAFSNETENSDGSYYNRNQEHHGDRPTKSAGFDMVPGRRSGSIHSSNSASQRLIAGNNEGRRELIRSRALLGFNVSAEYFGLSVLTPEEIPTSTAPVEVAETPARQTSLLNRLRKVKSNLTVKRKDNTRHSLRRIKTMANINVQVQYGTLEGKPIEDLARLGGESVLTFPREYGPGVLRLPTCIAAPVHFLLQHGTSAPYGYGSSWDESVVSALYGHYATQILRAERVKETISRTTRSVRLPSGYVYKYARTRGDAHVQDISSVLRHFLCELPGGILGSSYLYSVLEKIHDQTFSAANESRDPGRKEYVPDMVPSLAAKVRMITMALLALTTDMQLELICAIFGLLALTADECADRKTAHQYFHLHGAGPCEFCMTLPTPRTLGRVFGSFLHDVTGVRELQPVVQFKLAEGTQSADVATMLVDLWKGIAAQLRMWEVLDGRE